MQGTQNGGDLWLSYWVDHTDDPLHSTSFYLVRPYFEYHIVCSSNLNKWLYFPYYLFSFHLHLVAIIMWHSGIFDRA